VIRQDDGNQPNGFSIQGTISAHADYGIGDDEMDGNRTRWCRFFHIAPSSVSRMNFAFCEKIRKQPTIEKQLFQSLVNK
jgi:hypothetical protein